jgi:hypothetical protein
LVAITATFDAGPMVQKVKQTMAHILSFRDLDAWQVAMELVVST